MEKKILEIIEKKVPHGGKKEISQKAGVSIHTVLRFFDGKSQNKKVLIAIEEYLNEVDTRVNKLNQIALTLN